MTPSTMARTSGELPRPVSLLAGLLSIVEATGEGVVVSADMALPFRGRSRSSSAPPAVPVNQDTHDCIRIHDDPKPLAMLFVYVYKIVTSWVTLARAHGFTKAYRLNVHR
ncbi:hypothetical protein GCM10009767_06550 [Kocuria aegyptia]|uniref:Uncharacterized protein n=1 Tax=Kocuria aegyptia TaxID=330943 RepID=A0ABN2K892_9MICC